MYRFIWHIGKDLYYYGVSKVFNPYITHCIDGCWIECEALTAEEVGQEMGGN